MRWERVWNAAEKEHNDKAEGDDFRNRLLDKDPAEYSIYHHYGIGYIQNLDDILSRKDESEIKKTIYQLEAAESTYLVDLMKNGIDSTKKVLDCGSGSGGVAFDLYKSTQCNIDGVTLAEKQVNFTNALTAKNGVSDKIKFHLMNMLELDFPDNTFDLAFSCETDMYIDLDKFYTSIARVLKKDGKYAMITWCRSDEHITNNDYADKVDAYYEVKMQHLSAYKTALNTAGFKILEFNDLTTESVDYWKIRKESSISSDVDTPFLEGLTNGYIKAISILAELA
ncbi:MAG: methyltransferase domain-containing protein [Candidatus Diapherotrites archaeon]|nr:methyltransferase domain-containing protein [Candidatus Diapherotrites archaeon]